MTDAASTAARHMTVLIADEHALMRDGLRMMVVDMLDDARFVDAHDAESLLQAARRNPQIRLALVDPKMPGMHGGLRVIEFACRYPKISLLIVSAMNSPEVMRRIMSLRTVHAFVPKSAGAGAIRLALEAAMQGKRLPPARVERAGSQPADLLTPRQEEIFRLLRQGLSNKMIASALGIGTGTVKNHITQILKVLNATNRTQAAQLSPEA
jgi:DNA-binding NarL/FixJ family response regulator